MKNPRLNKILNLNFDFLGFFTLFPYCNLFQAAPLRGPGLKKKKNQKKNNFQLPPVEKQLPAPSGRMIRQNKESYTQPSTLE